jgi:ferredoxin-NADP reductase/MOSC domain-containing protein YiiM
MGDERGMTLVGFNTGRIRSQTIDGEVVRTGYVKTTAPRPWIITSGGADGDEVAVHADHLYAFDRESYGYWARELGVDRGDWSDGHFAENLTLDTLDQDDLRVGDRFRVGSAELVVTGPRVPCWKLTWRLGQPKTFMRRFRLSGHSGVYLGVVTPGVVAPGDRFERVGREDGAPTVALLSALCDSGTPVSTTDRTTIERALASPHLSPTVRSTLSLKLANLERDGGRDPAAWRGWRPFRVDELSTEAGNAVSVRLTALDGGPLPRYDAGQHVVVRLTEFGHTPVVRTWSLSDWQREPSHYRVTVKLRPDGRGSSLLARAGERGISVELRAPAGSFRLDRGSFRPVVLVATGIGITPLMAMLRAHLDRELHTPPLWLLYGSTNAESTVFGRELDELFSRHEDLQLHLFHSRDEASATTTAGGATVHHGRITAERIVDVLRANYLRTPEGPASIPWFESDVYLCGTPEFAETVRDGLVTAGANPDHVTVEEFAAALEALGGPRRVTDATVIFRANVEEDTGRVRRTVIRSTWRAASERTPLELGEDDGLTLPFDCRTGTCRTCEARIVGGEVEGATRRTRDGSMRALLCSSFPASEHVEIEALDD